MIQLSNRDVCGILFNFSFWKYTDAISDHISSFKPSLKSTLWYSLLKTTSNYSIPVSANSFSFVKYYVLEINLAPEIKHVTLLAFKIKCKFRLDSFNFMLFKMLFLIYSHEDIRSTLFYYKMNWFYSILNWIILSDVHTQVLNPITKSSKLHFTSEIINTCKNHIPNVMLVINSIYV